MNENKAPEAASSAPYNKVMIVNPAIALPNKRKERDNHGAHIDNKLTGNNTGIGSMYRLKYLILLYLTAVA